jgi:hypothetical protein
MSTQETRHQVRTMLDESFLKVLESEHEITIGTNGRIHGLQECLKRLYAFRRDRLERDRISPGGQNVG